VPQELIKQFFAYWWPTPIGSPERKRIKFAIKRGAWYIAVDRCFTAFVQFITQ
jgi:hypothetical protein